MTENLFHPTHFGGVAEVQREKGNFGGLFCSRPVTEESLLPQELVYAVRESRPTVKTHHLHYFRKEE